MKNISMILQDQLGWQNYGLHKKENIVQLVVLAHSSNNRLRKKNFSYGSSNLMIFMLANGL